MRFLDAARSGIREFPRQNDGPGRISARNLVQVSQNARLAPHGRSARTAQIRGCDRLSRVIRIAISWPGHTTREPSRPSRPERIFPTSSNTLPAPPPRHDSPSNFWSHAPARGASVLTVFASLSTSSTSTVTFRPTTAPKSLVLSI